MQKTDLKYRMLARSAHAPPGQIKMQTQSPLPHASLDLTSRAKKALKIERLLDLQPREEPIELLEIGTGSGGIAHYFANHPQLNCNVSAVDRVDQRQIHLGIDFKLVQDTHLPYPDGRFDVVISNHVIEHVGEEPAQRHHLSEIRRVMKADGIGYLAAPNRWMLVEPHYQLPFLSCLPRSLQTPYLRLFGHGEGYDCFPLSKAKIESLLKAGFNYDFLSSKAIYTMIDIADQNTLALKILALFPFTLLDAVGTINPTLIYRIIPKR
ncbi:MAG: class I SAM-dependent methyltransferase [Methylococcales bacterium]|nr:class I SAM-dependent methyltransferase [Methylococcales bacterium]